jgi:hypothetical protein
MPPVRNGASCGLNNCRIFGDRDNLPAMQQPDQTSLIVSG